MINYLNKGRVKYGQEVNKMEEPAEQLEMFQYELLKKMDKLIEDIEKVNTNLEGMKLK